MQSMEDTSSSAILVLDEETSPASSAKLRQEGLKHTGCGSETASPGQQSPVTPQKPSPSQSLVHLRDIHLASMRRSSVTKTEPMEHQHELGVAGDPAQLVHHSAFTRNAAILASQQHQLHAHHQHPHTSGGNSNYPPSTTQTNVPLPPAYAAGLMKPRRSNSTETVAAYDVPPYLYQQQQALHAAGATAGATLPSASASSLAASGCLSNGLPAPQVSGVQNRSVYITNGDLGATGNGLINIRKHNRFAQNV